MVLFAIPMAVALSQWTGIFGRGWPRSLRVSLKIIPSWQFRNNAPSLASAANATTNRKIKHSVWKSPLSLMGFPSIGKDPMKKMSACSAAGVLFAQIQRIRVDVHHHV